MAAGKGKGSNRKASNGGNEPSVPRNTNSNHNTATNNTNGNNTSGKTGRQTGNAPEQRTNKHVMGRASNTKESDRRARDEQKEKIEMARKIRRQTNSMNFKIRFTLAMVGLGVCIYFIITAIFHGYGSEVLSFMKRVRDVPAPVVAAFDVAYGISFFLLSWYILTNRHGHYTFWALQLSTALCVVSAFVWFAFLVVTQRDSEAHVPWHLLGLPLTFLAVNLVVFVVDKELRRAVCGEYEFRQIIRERGCDE